MSSFTPVDTPRAEDMKTRSNAAPKQGESVPAGKPKRQTTAKEGKISTSKSSAADGVPVPPITSPNESASQPEADAPEVIEEAPANKAPAADKSAKVEMWKHKWSEKDKKFLLDNWNAMTPEAIGARLKRTPLAVKKKWNALQDETPKLAATKKPDNKGVNKATKPKPGVASHQGKHTVGPSASPSDDDVVVAKESLGPKTANFRRAVRFEQALQSAIPSYARRSNSVPISGLDLAHTINSEHVKLNTSSIAGADAQRQFSSDLNPLPSPNIVLKKPLDDDVYQNGVEQRIQEFEELHEKRASNNASFAAYLSKVAEVRDKEPLTDAALASFAARCKAEWDAMKAGVAETYNATFNTPDSSAPELGFDIEAADPFPEQSEPAPKVSKKPTKSKKQGNKRGHDAVDTDKEVEAEEPVNKASKTSEFSKRPRVIIHVNKRGHEDDDQTNDANANDTVPPPAKRLKLPVKKTTQRQAKKTSKLPAEQIDEDTAEEVQQSNAVNAESGLLQTLTQRATQPDDAQTDRSTAELMANLAAMVEVLGGAVSFPSIPPGVAAFLSGTEPATHVPAAPQQPAARRRGRARAVAPAPAVVLSGSPSASAAKQASRRGSSDVSPGGSRPKLPTPAPVSASETAEVNALLGAVDGVAITPATQPAARRASHGHEPPSPMRSAPGTPPGHRPSSPYRYLYEERPEGHDQGRPELEPIIMAPVNKRVIDENYDEDD